MTEVLDLSRLQPPGVTEEFATREIEDWQTYWNDQGGLDTNKVETVDCSLCGAPCPSDILFERERFPYRKCPNCGLVYPSPRPRLSYLEDQYLSGRFAATFHKLYLPSAPYRMATIFKERVQELIMPRVPSGRVLDVGCSSGHFLKVAADHGFEVHGIEPNMSMVEYATHQLGLPNIHCGTLGTVELPPDFFDVVTLWDVLEHVDKPSLVLQQVMPILKPGGWLFAYTENIDSFNVFVTREYSEIITPDVHLRHYSPQTFRREFEQAGFQVETVHTNGLDFSHIRKTFDTHEGAFPEMRWTVPQEREAEYQEFINEIAKGDNLRLFARKMV